MPTVTIYISKQPNGTGLVLSDSEGHRGDNTITTLVRPGNTVMWQLKAGGGIDALTTISAKERSEDIFSAGPAPVEEGNPTSNWQGTISSSAKGKEAYNIGYEIGENAYLDDPELEVEDDG